MNLLLLILGLFLYSSALAQEPNGKQSILALAFKADFQCLDLKVLGPCVKKGRVPPVGVWVKYWQPELFMETVKMPGAYVIQEYGVLLQSLAQKVAEAQLQIDSVTSGSLHQSMSGRNTHFNEVHVYDFPLEGFIDVVLCSDIPNNTLGIRYLTEADSLSWRKGSLERKLPQSIVAPRLAPQCSYLPAGAGDQCMKIWGPLYPREGFVVAANEAAGSVIGAMRSVSIAGQPLPSHIVESKLDFQPNLSIDKIQMVYPQRTSCFSIGQDHRSWETQSKDGQYVWIYWHQRQCCL